MVVAVAWPIYVTANLPALFAEQFGVKSKFVDFLAGFFVSSNSSVGDIEPWDIVRPFRFVYCFMFRHNTSRAYRAIRQIYTCLVETSRRDTQQTGVSWLKCIELSQNRARYQLSFPTREKSWRAEDSGESTYRCFLLQEIMYDRWFRTMRVSFKTSRSSCVESCWIRM